MLGYSSATFTLLLSKITLLPLPNEGDLSCLLYLIDFVKNNCIGMVNELLKKYLPSVNSKKHTVKARMLSLDFAVEISLMSEDPQDTYNVMNAMQILLEEVSDVALRKQIYMMSSRAFRLISLIHSLVSLANSPKRICVPKTPRKGSMLWLCTKSSSITGSLMTA
jgi:hypothetical protein